MYVCSIFLIISLEAFLLPLDCASTPKKSNVKREHLCRCVCVCVFVFRYLLYGP